MLPLSSEDSTMSDSDPKNSFVEQASASQRKGLVGEFIDFLKENKKWWLAPIVTVIVGLGLLVMLSGTAAAPFIYTLF